MLDKQFKLEGKIRNGQFLTQKVLKLKANLTLKIKAEVANFQNSMRNLVNQQTVQASK